MDKTEHINLKIDGTTGGFIVPDNLAIYQVTIRDYFAANAMNAQMLGAIQGKSEDLIFAMNKIGTDDPYVLLAKNSYDMADAMLDARNADNSDIALAEERLKTVDTAIKVDINEI